MKNVDKVALALEAYKGASLDLILAVEQAYPVGSVVTVSIGNSTFQAKIEGHNQYWWSDPGEMHGKNLKTGTSRRFSPNQIVEAARDE